MLKWLKQQRIFLLFFLLIINLQPGKSADNVTFVSGLIERTVSVKDINRLAKTGEAKGTLKRIIKYSNQDPKDLAILFANSLLCLPAKIFTSEFIKLTISIERLQI